MVGDKIMEEHDFVVERTMTNGENDLYTVRQFMNQGKEWLVHYRPYNKHIYCPYPKVCRVAMLLQF